MPITFRPLLTSDCTPLKDLHEQLFPVKYADSFYTNAVYGSMVSSRHGSVPIPLFSRVAVTTQPGEPSSCEELAGVVITQNIPAETCKDKELVSDPSTFPLFTYVMTLGTCEPHRRHGLATSLLNVVLDEARLNDKCGLVYLHVITTNLPAIRFYEVSERNTASEPCK